MWLSDKWQDFELLDCSHGEKLERWGDYILVRPDPQAIWDTPRRDARWRGCDGKYTRSETGGGAWDKRRLPASWQIGYGELRFNIKPMNFKHTGIFPEQAANWDYIMRKIRSAGREISVLNLFAYTGGATLACAAAGAHVTHVDAAKGMVLWARENRDLSGIPEERTRLIIEDAKAFVRRELRRGNRYDGILMDPPSYGRGPGGEVWKLENELYPLVDLCAQALSDTPLFFLINGYTTGFSASVLGNIARRCLVARYGGKVEADELCLTVTTGGVLPCGTTARWLPDA